ncbi:MAG: transcriptional regulator [Spirochaetes bacterium]|nr:MAG: transcriptional regulator [Spirochaetota bacterium]
MAANKTNRKGIPDTCETYSPCYRKKPEYYQTLLMEVAGLSEIFKVLSDETRTKILYLLSDGELCVCDLADILTMSLPAVSHHLRLLRTMRLVKYRRDGKQAYYSLDDDHIVQLIRLAQQHFTEER